MGSGDTSPGEVFGRVEEFAGRSGSPVATALARTARAMADRSANPATAQPGDVWASAGTGRQAFLYWPEGAEPDAGSYSWLRIHPPAGRSGWRWFRTRELPEGTALQFRGGGQVAR